MAVEGATYAPCLVYEGYVLLLYVDIGGPRKLEALLPRSDSAIVSCGESMMLQRLQCTIGGKEMGRY
jgi:hypothetical protein